LTGVLAANWLKVVADIGVSQMIEPEAIDVLSQPRPT
jgi:hypothetical protein